ncbi:MAG: ROK family protein, partial [Paramuribaculum sp.]
FGMGMVIDNHLNRGNNSCAETFCLRHKNYPEVFVEEGVAIRAIKRVYAEKSGDINHKLEPKDICDIAEGKREGNKEAAIAAFEEFGTVAGDAIATAVTLTDSLVVLGGGLTGAKKFFMPSLLAQLRGVLHSVTGEEIPRMPMKAFNLDDEEEFVQFAHGAARPIKVYGTDRTVIYDPLKSTGVAISKLGASKAISIGAYSFALSMLDKND